MKGEDEAFPHQDYSSYNTKSLQTSPIKGKLMVRMEQATPNPGIGWTQVRSEDLCGLLA